MIVYVYSQVNHPRHGYPSVLEIQTVREHHFCRPVPCCQWIHVLPVRQVRLRLVFLIVILRA